MRVVFAVVALLGLVALAGVSAKKASTTSQVTAQKCASRFRAERLAALDKTYQRLTSSSKKKHKHHTKKHHNKDGHSCEVEVVLLDDYGDGWNGGKIDVLVDGEVKMAGITLDDGKRADAKLDVASGSHVSFKYTKGDYPAENEFRLKFGEDIIFQNGHSGLPPTPESQVSNAIQCDAPAEAVSHPCGESLEDCPFRVRKEWRDMTTEEQKLYLGAVNELKKSGVYDQFVEKHKLKTNKAFAHGNNGFLPWHRSFMWDFESSLRVLGGEYACVTLPYWDWSIDSGDFAGSALFAAEAFGQLDNDDTDEKCVITGAFAGWKKPDGECLKRRVRVYNGKIPGPATIMSMVAGSKYKTYNKFRPGIEFNGHGQVHMKVGGDMAGMGSPADPLFFLHHCNIDRVWALWQDCHDFDLVHSSKLSDGDIYHEGTDSTHSTKAKAPLDTPMVGHETTPRLMHSIVDMGYRYNADSFFEHSQIKNVCNPKSKKEGSAWAFFHAESSDQQTELLAMNSKQRKKHQKVMRKRHLSKIKGAAPPAHASTMCDEENAIVQELGCADGECDSAEVDACLKTCVTNVEKKSCEGDSINICNPAANDVCAEFAKEFNLDKQIAGGCCSDILCGSGDVGEGSNNEYGGDLDEDISEDDLEKSTEGTVVEADHPDVEIKEIDGTADVPMQEV